jgi:hypothetical protein
MQLTIQKMQSQKQIIDGKLPRFNQLLSMFGNLAVAQIKQDPKLAREYERAAAMRKSLLEHFAQFDELRFYYSLWVSHVKQEDCAD